MCKCEKLGHSTLRHPVSDGIELTLWIETNAASIMQKQATKTNYYPLIGPNDPAPYSVVNEAGDARVLFVCDHASRAFPSALGQLGLADEMLRLHIASDIGSAELTRILSERFDAPAVLAGYSRLLVDCNRPLNHPSAFIEVSDGVVIPGNVELSAEEKAQRTQSFFEPYHQAIATHIGLFQRRDITPAVISIHTCAPTMDGFRRPWHIGVLWDTDPRIAKPLIDRLARQEGVCVGDNEPYSGRDPEDHTIDFHAVDAGLPHVGIEVRQDLVTKPRDLQKWATLLGDALSEILASDTLYRPLKTR